MQNIYFFYCDVNLIIAIELVTTIYNKKNERELLHT